MRIKKVLHINGMRELTNGQRQQLNAEYLAASKLKNVQWDILALHTGKLELPFEKHFPYMFKPRLLRQFYTWCIILKYQKKYDLILVRHLTFDPAALLFAFFTKNRITIHHSKEIEELKLIRKGPLGMLASYLESITGKQSLRNVKAVIGVTNEIANYQNIARSLNNKVLTYPNGVDIASRPIAEDLRDDTNINVAFVCSKFTEWHGLDILLDSFKKESISTTNIKVHLIGELNAEQINIIESNSYFIHHGFLEKHDYIKVLGKCDISLGSLALYRQNMNEGSTLKVRDMLSVGLPVYSTHIDSTMSDSHPFYFYDSHVNINNIISYALEMKKYSRADVREATKYLVDKSFILHDLISDLNQL